MLCKKALFFGLCPIEFATVFRDDVSGRHVALHHAPNTPGTAVKAKHKHRKNRPDFSILIFSMQPVRPQQVQSVVTGDCYGPL
jgi:hypothetical protein